MERIRYFDFDLSIERAPNGYRARVIQSPAGQASTEFVLPFTDQDIEILMLRVGRARRGVRRMESPEMQAAKQFGGKLFDSVFAGDVRVAFRSSIDTANRESEGLRIRLRLGDAPELVDLPWEFLYNSTLNRFLALSNKTPLVRYIELPETPRVLKITPPLHILVMISSPSDYETLDVEREWQKLNDALQELIASNMVTLGRLDVATLGALRRKLRQGQYHVLHFIGHGGFDTQAQDGVLLLEDEQGRGRRTDGQSLATVLTDHDSLRLAVLNACEGARAARTDPFSGIAQSLVQQGMPAVIAMQFEITDEASITFAHEFYAALSDGYPVDASLSSARGAIFAEVNDLEWGTPVLYLRAPDGVIFEPDSPSATRQILLVESKRAEPELPRPPTRSETITPLSVASDFVPTPIQSAQVIAKPTRAEDLQLFQDLPSTNIAKPNVLWLIVQIGIVSIISGFVSTALAFGVGWSGTAANANPLFLAGIPVAFSGAIGAISGLLIGIPFTLSQRILTTTVVSTWAIGWTIGTLLIAGTLPNSMNQSLVVLLVGILCGGGTLEFIMRRRQRGVIGH